MNAYTRFSVALLAVGALMDVALPAALAAQGASSAPIFLALPDAFPDMEARAILMREPGRDIVILDSADADPETLAVALMLLSRLRQDGTVVDRGQLVPVTGFVLRRELDDERATRLEAVLTALRDRPATRIGNLGPGRWIPFRPL